MKTKLYAWVAVDGNGQANMFRLKPYFDSTRQEFLANEEECEDEGYFLALGECSLLAGQCWRIEIPGPKTATKKRRAKR